jgi:hypothetical protein
MNEEHGGVDILVNNAGRSIRRGIENSFDRFHDFERTMEVNYFGALRLTMGFLPAMIAKRKGHVINISSIGVLTNAPRFSAYVASKGGDGRLGTLRRVGVCRSRHRIHDHQHAAGQDANDRADQALRSGADAVAGGCGRSDRRSDHPQAGTHCHATGHFRRPAALADAKGRPDNVMNTSFRMFPDSSAAAHKQQEPAAADGRPGGLLADHARDSLLISRLPGPAADNPRVSDSTGTPVTA